MYMKANQPNNFFSKIEAIVSSICNDLVPFPIARKVVASNPRKDAKPVVTGIIESNNHADTWCSCPNFVMNHFTGPTHNFSGHDKMIQ